MCSQRLDNIKELRSLVSINCSDKQEEKDMKFLGQQIVSLIVIACAILVALFAWPWVTHVAQQYAPQIVAPQK